MSSFKRLDTVIDPFDPLDLPLGNQLKDHTPEPSGHILQVREKGSEILYFTKGRAVDEIRIYD